MTTSSTPTSSPPPSPSRWAWGPYRPPPPTTRAPPPSATSRPSGSTAPPPPPAVPPAGRLGPDRPPRPHCGAPARIRDFAAQWFDGTGQPTGILTSDAATYEDAVRVRNAWNGLDEKGERVDQSMNPSGIKVLPRGFQYSPLAISPKDAQWVEAQEFSILQVARLFGVPSTLMLAAPQGGSMTYSNVEQDWISFTRFSLMAYLRPLEEALSDVAVRGQDVRFNLDALLRSDTKTRYDAYAVALDKGFMTINEVRALENRDPLQEDHA